MNVLSIFLALTPKLKMHFKQLLHSTQDSEILDHGSKCLPLYEKWWDLRIFRLASITELLLTTQFTMTMFQLAFQNMLSTCKFVNL